MALYFLNRCLISYPNTTRSKGSLPRSSYRNHLPLMLHLLRFLKITSKLQLNCWNRAELYYGQRWQGIDFQLTSYARLMNSSLINLGCYVANSNVSRCRVGPCIVRAPHHRLILMLKCREVVSFRKSGRRQLEIRGDFSNFLQAVPFTALRTAAAEGPIIITNLKPN